MRKHLRKYLPNREAVRANRWLAPFAGSLLHPRLWHLNRHSAAGAVAAGLFCGLIPGPFQMFTAALCALAFRVNLPLALLTTLYSNPLTIVPLYVAAFGLGKLSLSLAGDETGGNFVPPPGCSLADVIGCMESLLDWLFRLGKPLVVGLVLLASVLAFLGYLLVRCAWRIYLLRLWHQRRQRGGMVGKFPQ